MLRIYYADGQTDKEKFIFDHVDPRRQTILLVPDQFSLQAEEDALTYCGSALLDLMVTDFSSLGHKVVREIDGHEPQIIDKYGRHMLLSVLLGQMNEELTVFRRRAGTSALAQQMNTMISEMKRYEIGPEELEQVIEELKGKGGDRERAAGSYLVLKLEDTLRIFRAYEEAISGLYRDAEDYITYYAQLIPQSALIRGADVWIYGFDTFTPKNLQVIQNLLLIAESVSIVMTYEDPADASPAERAAKRTTESVPEHATECGPGSEAEHATGHATEHATKRATGHGEDECATGTGCSLVRSLTQGGGAGLFLLTERVMQRLESLAEDTGLEHSRQRIDGYQRQGIWTIDPDMLRDRIRLARTSASYEEAERTAAQIQTLVRDEGYRYGEIAVLCNDMDGRGRQLLRAFERWEIPAFADQKRKVLHQPVVSFLLSFLDVLNSGFGGSGIIGMIKSGMTGWSMEDEILLENYITEFRIRGNRWREPFVLDGGKYTDEELTRVNEMRAFLVSFCEEAKDAIGRRNTAEEKVRGLIAFLQEGFRITERIEEAVERQQALGLSEGAMETAQIWNAVCGIFEQIIGIVGQDKVSNKLLQEMIRAGLESLEIGLVPASRDCVIMGTLQRSRPGQIRVLIVTGANAGLLPLDMRDEGLLSRREKEQLEEMELEFAGRERVARLEEQLAIYRMFSLPSERLYVSCSQSGDDGSMLRPSEVFQRLQKWQPEVAGDLGDGEILECIGSRRATVPYLAEALRDETNDGASMDGTWAEVLRWYRENDPLQVGRLLRGAHYDNRLEALGDEMADALYRGDRGVLQVSASRLEKYSSCPFAHFVRYGLRAQEQQLFEVGGREIGDVYHQCMMAFSRSLEEASAAAGEAAPTWETITEEACRERVAQILRGNAENYREGLFASDAYSTFRMERITEICGDIAWAMVQQVRQGRIRRMYFEEPFGKGPSALQLPAIDVNVGDRKVEIRGVIDRVDVIDPEEGPEGIRIVDYKTGSDTIRTEDFRSGYKLQLMVYMDAALRAEAGTGNEADTEQPTPAGVFYFKISDFTIDGDQPAGVPDPKDPGDLQRRMAKYYRMEGVVVNDPALIGAMDARVDGKDKAESLVIPVKYDPKKECYQQTGGGTLLETKEFKELMDETNRQVERICAEICTGEISPAPKRETRKDRDGKRITACRYCGFPSICGFDPSIKGCRYVDI